MVVRGGIEPPTPRFSGTEHRANWVNCGELSELAVAEAVVGWTDLDRDAALAVSRGPPAGGTGWAFSRVRAFPILRVCRTVGPVGR